MSSTTAAATSGPANTPANAPVNTPANAAANTPANAPANAPVNTPANAAANAGANLGGAGANLGAAVNNTVHPVNNNNNNNDDNNNNDNNNNDNNNDDDNIGADANAAVQIDHEARVAAAAAAVEAAQKALADAEAAQAAQAAQVRTGDGAKRKRDDVVGGDEDAADNSAGKKLKTSAAVIITVDRSASMNSYGKEEIAGAIQDAIDGIPDARGDDATLTLDTFDHEQKRIAENVLAKGYKIDPEEVAPRGSTALRDAVVRAIEHGKTLPDKKVYIIVFTDGHDNHSTCTTEGLTEMVNAAMAAGMDFTWLAAGPADMRAATSMGIAQKDVMKVGAKGHNMRAAMRYSSRKSRSGFSDMDRQVSGGGD